MSEGTGNAGGGGLLHRDIPNGATAAGLLLAPGAFSIVSFLPEEQLLSWGWRLPFVASVVILLVAVFFRQHLQETPAFREEVSEGEVPPRLPVKEVLTDRPRDVLCGFLSVSGHNANAYVLNTFALSYVTATLGLAQGVGLFALFVDAGAGVVVPICVVGEVLYGEKRGAFAWLGQRNIGADARLLCGRYVFPRAVGGVPNPLACY